MTDGDLGPVCVVCGYERRDPDANHSLRVHGRLIPINPVRQNGHAPHEFEPLPPDKPASLPPMRRATRRRKRRSTRPDPFASRRVAR